MVCTTQETMQLCKEVQNMEKNLSFFMQKWDFSQDNLEYYMEDSERILENVEKWINETRNLISQPHDGC